MIEFVASFAMIAAVAVGLSMYARRSKPLATQMPRIARRDLEALDRPSRPQQEEHGQVSLLANAGGL